VRCFSLAYDGSAWGASGNGAVSSGGASAGPVASPPSPSPPQPPQVTSSQQADCGQHFDGAQRFALGRHLGLQHFGRQYRGLQQMGFSQQTGSGQQLPQVGFSQQVGSSQHDFLPQRPPSNKPLSPENRSPPDLPQVGSQQAGSSQQAGASQQATSAQALHSPQPPLLSPNMRSRSSKPNPWPHRATLTRSAPITILPLIELQLLFNETGSVDSHLDRATKNRGCCTSRQHHFVTCSGFSHG